MLPQHFAERGKVARQNYDGPSSGRFEDLTAAIRHAVASQFEVAA